MSRQLCQLRQHVRQPLVHGHITAQIRNCSIADNAQDGRRLLLNCMADLFGNVQYDWLHMVS